MEKAHRLQQAVGFFILMKDVLKGQTSFGIGLCFQLESYAVIVHDLYGGIVFQIFPEF